MRKMGTFPLEVNHLQISTLHRMKRQNERTKKHIKLDSNWKRMGKKLFYLIRNSGNSEKKVLIFICIQNVEQKEKSLYYVIWASCFFLYLCRM